MSEFDFIGRFLEELGGIPAPGGVRLGSGDDGAILSPARWSVVVTDTLVEGIHWDPRYSDLSDVGYKLLAVNLSDMVAMGALAGPFLINLSLPTERVHQDIAEVIAGLSSARVEHGLDSGLCVPIGGDMTRTTGPRVLTLTLFGQLIGQGRPFLRSNARRGDLLWVSGRLGSAAGGLEAFLADLGDLPRFSALVSRHKRPRIRTEMLSVLVDLAGLGAVMDLSDGLGGDLQHILRASSAVQGTELGAEIHLDCLPTDQALADLCARIERDPVELAVSGGEDFELLVTARAGSGNEIRLGSAGFTQIGRIVDGPGITFLNHGQPIAMGVGGFDHFGNERDG
ncbi:MAG: thiamine-phosphate kinase [Myxococcales bacterium]|nr:thiamine-phosphate kinase [Myxococcales bacterium]